MTATGLTDSVNALMEQQQLLPFVPPAELAGILAGSFQDTTTRIAETLREESHTLFGGRSARLLGVFPDAAVVLVEGGDLLRLRYEKGATGAVYFTGSEVLPVTVVTKKNVRRFVQNEARAAADLFLRGLTEQANAKIAALAPLVDAVNVLSDEEVLKSLAESRASHQWRVLVAERRSHIQPLLEGTALPEPLSPKFSRLYDGSTKLDDLSGFEALVTDDVEHLVSRLAAVESQAVAALQTVRTVREQAAREGGQEVVATLEAFATDLLSDVSTVKEFVVEAATEFGRVDRIAKVFDSIASEVASFEVAGAFAAKMAARLT